MVLKAEPGATIGVGHRVKVTRKQLRKPALDGSMEQLVDWCPAAPGDILYSAAGTVHALGAGLTLVEVQQNVDPTYRLYDYGRPRELHLDEGIQVSDPCPYKSEVAPYLRSDGREILAEGRAFTLERWSKPFTAGTLHAAVDQPVWLVPVGGSGSIAGERMEPGSVWLADNETPMSLDEGSELFVAYPGNTVRDDLIG